MKKNIAATLITAIILGVIYFILHHPMLLIYAVGLVALILLWLSVRYFIN